MIRQEDIPAIYSYSQVFVVPTGRDQEPCLRALNDCGVILPTFPEDVDVVSRPDGNEVRRVKAVEGALSIADGSAWAGVMGTDVLENLPQEVRDRLEYVVIGPSMGRLCLLGKAGEADELRNKIFGGSEGDPVEFTSKLGFMAMRRVVDGGLRAILSSRGILGSEEASVGWKARMTGAIVETGRSKRAHGLEVLAVLAEIYPAFVRARIGTTPYVSPTNAAIVEAVLREREEQ